MKSSEIDEVLTRIDAQLYRMSEDEEDTDFILSLEDVLALRAITKEFSRQLVGIRSLGLPKYVKEDFVEDITLGNKWYISNAEVLDGINGMEWHYRYGFYWIPESDIKILKPRKMYD